MLGIENIDNASIEIYLMGRVYPNALVTKFLLNIPINGVPYGFATIQNVDDANDGRHCVDLRCCRFSSY